MTDKKKQWQKMWDRYDDTDEKVRETVTALNLLGVNTIASCEGHMDHGIAAPWIDVVVEMNEEIANLTRKADELQDSAELLLKEMTNQHEARRLLSEYEQVKDKILLKNLQETVALSKLLEEFYVNREINFRIKLVINIYGRGVGRVISQGGLYQEAYPEDEQNEYMALYQNEMQKFGNFLKNKWFVE